MSLLTGCGRGSRVPQARVGVWTLPSPQIPNDVAARFGGIAPSSLGPLFTIDTISMRAVQVRRGGSGYEQIRTSDTTMLGVDWTLPAVITTHQGNRYHPETLRALANDTVVLASFARSLTLAARDMRIILDFQSATPDDVPEMVEVARAIGRITRTEGVRSLSMIVPASDTVAYPTLVLARVADWLIIRLQGQHRPGTAPGPLVTAEFAASAIGMRARLIGASRVGVEIPMFGYVWDKNGSAAPITYVDAEALVRGESGVFTRDPPSRFLTARGRDGWTIWVPDARTIQFLREAVQRRGITSIHLAGPEGADPALLAESNRSFKR